MKSKNERGLDRRVLDITTRVEQLVKKEYGLRWWKPRKEDEYRMLRLLQWEEKYKVSVKWIVSLLVPIWKNKYARYQKNGIGVTIATLVGKKSEEILVQCIQEHFPDGENRGMWKAAAQNGQWRRMQEEKRRITWEEPMQAMSQYRKSIQAEREQLRKFRLRMKRRRYRNSPWL